MQNKRRPELPAQPMRSAAPRRSGQLARLTEEIRAGEKSDCCDDAAFVGGDRKQSPQQPCSRPHHESGRVRLPGRPGLDGTGRPGRRRADARYVRRRGSFGSLHHTRDEVWSICAQPRQTLLVQIVESYSAAADVNNSLHDMRIRSVFTGFVPLVCTSTVQRQQTSRLRHAQPFRQSPALHIHAPYSANR